MYAPRLALCSFEEIAIGDRLEVIRALVEAVVFANRAWLRLHPETPLLYASGVRYELDPLETWGDIPAVLSARAGDCKDLVAWRLAELRERSGEERAVPFLRKFIVQGPHPHLEYHVQLRRADGVIEDPSAVLGMPQTVKSEKRRV